MLTQTTLNESKYQNKYFTMKILYRNLEVFRYAKYPEPEPQYYVERVDYQVIKLRVDYQVIVYSCTKLTLLKMP